MGTKTYDSATDLITFSRASGGTALSKISYGNNLVTNGTFDTDLSGWTTDTAWVYSNGKASLPANAQSNLCITSRLYVHQRCSQWYTPDSQHNPYDSP